MILQSAAFAALGLLANSGAPYEAMVLPLIVAGAGVSMVMPAQQNAVIGSVPPAAIGTASGTLNTLRQLGGTFGVAILAAVFAANGSYASPAAFTQGFVPALGVGAAMSLVAAIIGGWIPARRPAVQPQVAVAPVPVEVAA